MESTNENILEAFDVGDVYFTVNALNEADAEHQVVQFMRIAVREYGKEYGIIDYDFTDDKNPSI